MLSCVRAGGKPRVDLTPPFGLVSVPYTQKFFAAGPANQWGGHVELYLTDLSVALEQDTHPLFVCQCSFVKTGV